MSRYVKRPRQEPTDENSLVGFMVFGPLVFLWRAVKWYFRIGR